MLVKNIQRVPTVAQWVKNPTAAAAEVQVQSLVLCSGLKDLALPQLGLRFSPWLGSFHMLRMWPLKKKKKKNSNTAKAKVPPCSAPIAVPAHIFAVPSHIFLCVLIAFCGFGRLQNPEK